MEKALQEHQTHALPNEDCTQKLPKFKGIRLRKWGSWGSEIRMPKSREKIWLGSYKTVEQAARAYDAAVYCLRGPNAKFNFSGSVPAIPSAFSLSRQQIQVAAAKYALDQIPSTSPSLNNSEGREREEISLGSPSRSSSVSERELWSDSQQISEERVFWESLFDSGDCLNFQKFPSIDDTSVLDFIPSFPSIDDTSVLDFIPSWQEEEQQDGYISLDLWSF